MGKEIMRLLVNRRMDMADEVNGIMYHPRVEPQHLNEIVSANPTIP